VTDPRVTVVCATRNARPAVRLTFASFRRYNPGSWRTFVADNGSTDGTLEDLRALAGVDVVSLPQRLALLRHEQELDRQAVARIGGRSPDTARLLSTALDEREPDPDGVAEHGATLDWLLARVRTPYALVMDSDVEFRAPGCLAGMLELASERGLAALGVHEAGHGGYRPRLAPYVLLLRTDVVRELGTSFRGRTVCEDAGEERRWQAYAGRFELDPAEVARFRATRIYPTGACFFERLVEAGHRWSDLPPGLAGAFHHFGHLSWGGLTDASGGSGRARAEHALNLAAVEAALQAYR
jgi:hypothetical protein